MDQPFLARRLSPVLWERMSETPVLLLEGPRGVGKSTLLRELSARREIEVFDLDDSAYLELARTNPTWVVDGQLPVLVDEYQKAPAILDAIKARLNRETWPGMYVLAGSASFDALPRNTQALTGRIQRVPVAPLTQTEIDGTENRFLERAFEGALPHRVASSTTSRGDYAARVTRGGMPLALAAGSEPARTRWFQAHVRQSLERDAGELRRLSRRADLPRILVGAAGQTAGLLNLSKLARTVEAPRDTVSSYLSLLESLFLLQRLPAWGTTVSSRTVSSPKVHVVDSGIGAHLLRLSGEKLARKDPSTLTEFGHLLESFVVQEVLRQASWLDDPVEAGHWRTRDDVEVDLVLERYDGAIIGIEVKAGDSVDRTQFAPLRALRDRVGSSFVAGIAFHLGKVGYAAEDRLHSLPVDRLWS